MATKKRSTGRAAAGRAKSTTRPRAAGRKAKPVAKPKRTTKARAAKSAKPPRGDKPKQPAAPKRAAAAESKDVVALKARFQRERSALERNLTEAVREIGVLRHHEIRAMQLERQLKERDELIGGLQQQLEELQRRAIEPMIEREVQQSFALVAPAHEEGDFQEDAQLVDETELEDEEA